jgi:DNA-binding Lrp family transcriptional regulator
MEISYQLYNWLKDSGIIKGIYEKVHYNIILNESDSEKLELGLLLKVFPSFVSNLPKESEMQQINTKVARLNNWNLLIKPLETLGVDFNSDIKALIVAGDRQQVAEVIQNLYKSIKVFTKKTSALTSFEGGVLLNNLNPASLLVDTQSVLEFMVLSLCKVLKVTTKVAVGLLAQNGTFLVQILKKGVKKDLTPIYDWYDLIESNFEFLLKLMKEESYTTKGLNLLISGIFSPSEEVQDKTFTFFSNILPTFSDLTDLAFDWFKASPKVLSQVFSLFQTRVDPTSAVNFLIVYSNLDYQLFWTNLKSFCGETLKYIKLTAKLLPSFAFLDVINDIFNSGLLQCWVDLSLNSENEVKGKGQYLMFLCDIWCSFIEYFRDHEELSVSIINFMKRVVRDGSKGLKIVTLGQIFEVFDTFSQQKVKYAPILYKTVIFILIEHFSSYRIREFITANLTRILSENDSIPLSPLIDPLVKQLLLLKPLQFQISDFDLLVALSRHPTLSIKEAILLIDLCGKIITSDSLYSLSSEIPFLIISSRFIHYSAFQDYLLKLISIIFNLHANKRFYAEIFKGKEARPVILVQKILELENDDFNNKLRQLLNYAFSDLKSVKDPQVEYLFKLLMEKPGFFMSLVPAVSQKFESVNSSQSNQNRAHQEIEKIRNRRLLKENQEKMQVEKNSLKQIVQKVSLEKEIKKRRIELGVKSRLYDEDEEILIASPASFNLPSTFLRVQDELPEIQKLLKSLFKRHSRVNRALFQKFAGSTKNPGSLTPSFERLSRKKDEMSESDFSLLLKQFSILNLKISVGEMKALFAELCKNSSKFINFQDFPDLLYMLSSLIASKNPALAKLPEILILNDFYLSLAQSSEGIIPKHFFTEPDPGNADREVIRVLNAKLEKDPEMQLSENYKKYEEIEISVSYQVTFGKKSRRRVIVILDEILFETFGFHFLMPVVSTTVKTRAKGILKAVEAVPGYLKKVESNPRFLKLSNHLKFHAMRLNYSEDIIIECSQLLDDLILTIEKGKKQVISKTPKPAGSLQNKIIQEREIFEMEKTLQVQRSEEKRKQRHQLISEKVEKHRFDKEYQEIIENRERKKQLMQTRIKELEKMKVKKLEKMEIERKILEYRKNKEETTKKPAGSVKSFRISHIIDMSKISPMKSKKVITSIPSRQSSEVNKSSSVPKNFSKLFKKD